MAAKTPQHLNLTAIGTDVIEGFGAVSVLSYGATGNGSTDDRAAIVAAVTAAAGGVVYFPPGTYRIASDLTFGASVKFVGDGATLLFDFVGDGITMSSAQLSFTATGITFDGNDKIERMLKLSSTNLLLRDCTIQNVYRDDADASESAYGIQDGGNSLHYALVERCVFNEINALADTIGGNAYGAPRAIIYAGANLTVRNCRFTNIQSVNVGGVPVEEDADAIQFELSGSAHSLIEGNYFSKCGKRAIKCFADDVIIANNIIINDTWSDFTEVMFAAIEITGDRCTVIGNQISGSYYHQGISFIGDGHLIEGNQIVDSQYAVSTTTYGNRSGIIGDNVTNLRVVGNRVTNFWCGLRLSSGSGATSQVSVTGNNFDSDFLGVYLTVNSGGSVTHVAIQGNTFLGRDTANSIGIVGDDNATDATLLTVVGNVFKTFKYGVQAPAAIGVVAANVFSDMGSGNYSLGSGFVTTGANAS